MCYLTILDHEMNHFLIIVIIITIITIIIIIIMIMMMIMIMIIIIIIQTLTIKDCKGPRTNMPKNVGSIKA